MDFIVNLLWSGEYNAIFVVVDRLTKHASFIPTTTGLTAEEFRALYVKHIGCRFGLPESIITDRDPRWTSDFWRGVAKYLKTKMSLSSSHHPQHDGQTEIVNKQLVTMLRAYINDDLLDWALWLHILEFSYNNAIHSSIGMTPFFLLYGFHPWTLLDFLGSAKEEAIKYSLSPEAVSFLETLAMHRYSARRAIATAQDKQAASTIKTGVTYPNIQGLTTMTRTYHNDPGLTTMTQGLTTMTQRFCEWFCRASSHSFYVSEQAHKHAKWTRLRH